MRSTAHTVKWERSPDLNARTDVRIEKSEHLETKWCYIAGIVVWLQYAIQNKSMCVCVCEARDLSSGAAFTGEKVKFTDLRRQEDILFGQKKKMHEKVERSLHSVLSEKAQNPIRETETGRKERKQWDQGQCCASMISGQLVNPVDTTSIHLQHILWPKHVILSWDLGAEDHVNDYSLNPRLLCHACSLFILLLLHDNCSQVLFPFLLHFLLWEPPSPPKPLRPVCNW